MSKLFNIRPRWRNLLLARVLLFAISIVLSSSGEDIGPNDTIEESLASHHRLQSGGISDINVRELQSKSAKSKSNKSSKSKGSKSKASKASGSKSKSGKAPSKMGKSSDKSKSSKSKAAKSTESKSKAGKSKSKASTSKSKIGKSLKSLDSGDGTDNRDSHGSSDSTESDTQPVKDNEQSDSVETSSLNRDVDYVKEDESFGSSSYSGSNGEGAAVVEHIDIISNEEAIVSTNGKTYNAEKLPLSSEEKTSTDTTQLEGDFMEERIDESKDTEVDIDEIMTEIIEESRAFEKEFDESGVELDPSRESVE